MSESTRGRRKSLVGKVVSVKMEKTAVVSVERRYPHRLYHKIIRSTKRYKAHDPQNAAVLGDTVRIVETRPISKEKRWRIVETMVRGNVADIAPREIGVPEESLYRPERPEPAPVAVAEATAEAETPETRPEATPAAEAAPEAKTPETTAEATPAAEATPEVEEAPATEAVASVEATPEADEAPATEAAASVEATPEVEEAPATEAVASVEATPEAEEAPATEAAASVEATPEAEEAPATEATEAAANEAAEGDDKQ